MRNRGIDDVKLSYDSLVAYIDGLYGDGELSEEDYLKITMFIIARGDLDNTARDLIQVRRGLQSDIPELAQGELGFAWDTENFYVGGLNGNVLITSAMRAVSVKQFGAIGNGRIDDSASFEKWINFIVPLGLSGYIPDGTYLISSGTITYRTPSDTKWSIQGQSTNNTILKFGYVQPVQPNHIDIRNVDNFKMENFTIECAGNPTLRTGIGLYLVDCNNSSFDNIDITKCSRGGVLLYSENYQAGGVCDNMKFTNVNIFGSYNSEPFDETGRHLFPMGWVVADATNTIIRQSDIKDIKWYGFEFKNYCKNSWFIDCNARHCVNACYIGGELRTGDIYGATGCGYTNITCYDVDTPITGGSFTGCTIDGITCYYSPDFVFFGDNEQYSGRLQNFKDSMIRCSIYGMPHGAFFLTDNCVNNMIKVDYITKSPDFVGRVFAMDDTCKNNTFIVEAHPMDLLIDRTKARVGENIIIDQMVGYYTNYNDSAVANREYRNNGFDNMNNGTFNYGGKNLTNTYMSDNNIITDVFGALSGGASNIQVKYSPDLEQVQFRFTKDGATKIVNITPTGVSTT